MVKMLQPAVTKQGASQDQLAATQIWTHEQLHASSNKDRPAGEPLGTDHSPDRWIEEATTELLAHHYTPQVATALSGQPAKKILPVMHELTLDGNVNVQVQLNVAYRDQANRFTGLACYTAGVKAGDSIEDINRVVLGYAAEVKKRGKDRYEYLADEVLKAHGVSEKEDPILHKTAKKILTEELSTFMGNSNPLYGSAVRSVSDTVNFALDGAYIVAKEEKMKNAPSTKPTMLTPLAVAEAPQPEAPAPISKVVAPSRGGRRSTLKKRL